MVVIQKEDSHLPGKLDFNMIPAEQTGWIILHVYMIRRIARKCLLESCEMRKIMGILMVLIAIAGMMLITFLLAPEPGNPISWVRSPTATATPIPTTTPIPSVIPGVARMVAIEGDGDVMVGDFTYQASSFGLHGWPVISQNSLITTGEQTQVDIEVGLRSQEPANITICPGSSIKISFGSHSTKMVLSRGFYTISQPKGLLTAAASIEGYGEGAVFSIQDGRLMVGIDPTGAHAIWVACLQGQCWLEDEDQSDIPILLNHALAIDAVTRRRSVPALLTNTTLSGKKGCQFEDLLLARSRAGELSIPIDTPTPIPVNAQGLKTVTISGKVTDSITGEAIEGVRILLTAPGWIDSFSDSSGSFKISGLPAGNYVLLTAKQGYVAQSRYLDLSDQDIGDIKLQLVKSTIETFTMTVTVSFEERGLAFVFILASGDLHGDFACITDKEGICTITGLPNDRYEVSGLKEGYTINGQVIYLLETNPTVTLSAARSE